MEVEILSEKDNRLLERKEMNVKVIYGDKKQTPKLSEVKEVIATRLNLDKNLMIIHNITQPFGVKYCDVYLKVYDNEDAMKVETRPVLRKNFGDERTNMLLGIRKKKTKGKKKGATAPENK